MQTLVPRSTLAAKPGMGTMKGLEQIGSRGFYRLAGAVTVQEGVELVANAIRAAREFGLVDMLVDVTETTGYGAPNTFDRYQMGAVWADAAGPDFNVAMVARAELIDPQKIGVLVAQNRQAMADVFATEAEALKWLEARQRQRQRRRPHDRPDEH
ncbi:MAG TPA: hypothetical protein VFV88_09825 [Steroidobacteraceae bacterium]|nr:hypothetical protein [Steroidobacteraceae bacterium]